MEETLHDKVLEMKQAVVGITSNETLDAFDMKFCEILDSERQQDSFIESRVKNTLKELSLVNGIDYSEHFRKAYENYNEAVTYYVLKQRGINIKGIPEAKTPTPDFEVVVDCSYPDEDEDLRTVYVEVKTLGFAEGNLIYKKAQEESLECQIKIEEQHKKGRKICSAERVVAPLGNIDFIQEIEKIMQKIEQNIKAGQFAYGDDKSTILFVDLNQLWFSRDKKECLAIYPDLIHNGCSSGSLWMIAFARTDERMFLLPEFEGKGCFSKEIQREGILNAHPEIKGIIFGMGRKPEEKTFFGFYRFDDDEEPTTLAMHRMCDFCNDNQNSNAWKFYQEYKQELGI